MPSPNETDKLLSNTLQLIHHLRSTSPPSAPFANTPSTPDAPRPRFEMEGKLNTAEHDHKGRCVRHPDVRLRKKKLLGGWKILIGHCPECCLDEMRRVRDEIDGGERKKKDKKKKHKHKDKGKRRGSEEERECEVSLTSEGYDPNPSESRHRRQGGGRHGDGGRRHREDGESEATGSTAQMSGGGSVVSEQYYRNDVRMSPGGHPDNSYRYHQQHAAHAPPARSPPQRERTMVLSMAFIDPQTGQRGTYTGQVDSAAHKPDGKGTVYYNNGTIAEGTWSNGVLLGDSDEEEDYSSRNTARGGGRVDRHQYNHDRPSVPARRAPEQDGSGNLHLLSGLPGAASRPRGGSASVQSYNSRGSHSPILGSASVQAPYLGDGGAYYGSAGGSLAGFRPPQRGHVERDGQYGRRYRGEYDP